MIKMCNIEKSYYMGDEKITVLSKISLNINRGEFVSVIGPSGSGKSTLMNIMGCLDTADSGEYYFNDKPIERYSKSALASIRGREIGFIFQGFNLLGRLTATENVELPLIYQGIPKKERNRLVKTALAQVNLSQRSHHKPRELSGGQQQRVAIARALVTKPALILADEPTGNLDSHNGDEIMQLIKNLHQNGNTIVLITHDTQVANQAQRVIRIFDGKMEDANL